MIEISPSYTEAFSYFCDFINKACFSEELKRYFISVIDIFFQHNLSKVEIEIEQSSELLNQKFSFRMFERFLVNVFSILSDSNVNTLDDFVRFMSRDYIISSIAPGFIGYNASSAFMDALRFILSSQLKIDDVMNIKTKELYDKFVSNPLYTSDIALAIIRSSSVETKRVSIIASNLKALIEKIGTSNDLNSNSKFRFSLELIRRLLPFLTLEEVKEISKSKAYASTYEIISKIAEQASASSESSVDDINFISDAYSAIEIKPDSLVDYYKNKFKA